MAQTPKPRCYPPLRASLRIRESILTHMHTDRQTDRQTIHIHIHDTTAILDMTYCCSCACPCGWATALGFRSHDFAPLSPLHSLSLIVSMSQCWAHLCYTLGGSSKGGSSLGGASFGGVGMLKEILIDIPSGGATRAATILCSRAASLARCAAVSSWASSPSGALGPSPPSSFFPLPCTTLYART